MDIDFSNCFVTSRVTVMLGLDFCAPILYRFVPIFATILHRLSTAVQILGTTDHFKSVSFVQFGFAL